MDGRVHHFGAIGLINALAVLADRETRSSWDHITGEAFAGPLSGHQLEVWPVGMTTAAAALAEYPDIAILSSPHRSLKAWVAHRLYPRFIHNTVRLPRFMLLSMSTPVDPRLDKLTQGLGVITRRNAKYYPIRAIPAEGIDDDWSGRILHVERKALDGVPRAVWKDGGEAPMQLLTRWYGFAFTYPNCELYDGSSSRAVPRE